MKLEEKIEEIVTNCSVCKLCVANEWWTPLDKEAIKQLTQAFKQYIKEKKPKEKNIEEILNQEFSLWIKGSVARENVVNRVTDRLRKVLKDYEDNLLGGLE